MNPSTHSVRGSKKVGALKRIGEAGESGHHDKCPVPTVISVKPNLLGIVLADRPRHIFAGGGVWTVKDVRRLWYVTDIYIVDRSDLVAVVFLN
ncbi:hypothetical protein CEXT_81151 [Caerostris extrusa]|uniref:Uncharacterized protein n=1 Tax=Caerostris extrusa TaxID=172846 RepID=A0AAV4S8W4_CAEEX|nr:hypothetical protein CEXT_81151 [Caerostris extrusa]